MHHIEQIQSWLSSHKSSTLPAWLSRNTEILAWVNAQYTDVEVKNIMERVYIILNGPPPYCEFGNKRQFNTFDLGYRAGCVLGNKCQCIKTIRLNKQTETLKQRYGVTAVSMIPNIEQRRKSTNQKKFGVDWPSQSTTVSDKIKKTRAEFSESRLNSIAEKTKQTYIQKYGVEHHMQNKSQVEKIKQTNILRYQTTSPLKNANIVAKMKTTLANKSKVEIEQSNNFRKLTLLHRYGVDAASKIPLSQTTLNILGDRQQFLNFIDKKTRAQVQEQLQIAAHTLYLYAKKYQASTLFEVPWYSKLETEIYETLANMLGSDYNILRNDRTLIAPLELDIYIPSKKIAIECNGLYWHSEASSGRDRNYHFNKFLSCQQAGVKLLTIFEDEWIYKKAAVLLRIKNALGLTANTVFARKCKIIECSTDQRHNFLTENHLQGSATADISLGLTYNDELVSVMTFARTRYNKQYQWEIIRFCSSLNIPGAAGKLFNEFLKRHNPESVLSYSDNRWGTGVVYQKLGFEKKSITPGYFYTDYKNRFSRLQYQKHKLVADGADKSLTEWQIMQQRGYDRIWDCGQTLWVYQKYN